MTSSTYHECEDGEKGDQPKIKSESDQKHQPVPLLPNDRSVGRDWCGVNSRGSCDSRRRNEGSVGTRRVQFPRMMGGVIKLICLSQ